MKLTSVEEVLAAGTGERKLAVADGPHSRVTLWQLEPGQEIQPHVHEGDHVWVVQKGQGWLLTEAGEAAVAPGSLALVPEGEPHGMRAGTQLVFVSVSAG
jgi:quercetin dioxygenase-like cupin family protein